MRLHDGSRPHAHLVKVLLRLMVPPYGPVVVPVWVQLPPAQLVEPVFVTVPPRGPVYVLVWLQEPPEQPPMPWDDQTPPYGPTARP
jgi:hypothetical protein